MVNKILPLFSGWIKPLWTVYRDVQYGITKSEVADLYLLNKGIRPVVIFIHGGGWSSGDKSAYEGRARKYALAGFHVIAINYRLATFDDKSTQWPAQLQDVQNAVRWVRQNAAAWRIDPSRIGVGGDSAGGHLALMLGCTPFSKPGDRAQFNATQSPWPTAILDMFGPVDLAMKGMTEFVCALPIFNRQTCGQRPDLYASACPLKLMTALFPPTIIFHGVNDATVPYAQSVYLDQRMTQLGVDHQFITFGGGHEFANMSEIVQTELEMQGLWWMMSKLSL